MAETKKKGGVISKQDKLASKATDDLLRMLEARYTQGMEDIGAIRKLRRAATDHLQLGTPEDLEQAERIHFKAQFQIEQLIGITTHTKDELVALQSRKFNVK